jgi:hypothetical protein
MVAAKPEQPQASSEKRNQSSIFFSPVSAFVPLLRDLGQ